MGLTNLAVGTTYSYWVPSNAEKRFQRLFVYFAILFQKDKSPFWGGWI